MQDRQKQRQLYYLGYYGDSLQEVDGIWGMKSRAATLAFQEDSGILADGIFGSHTRNKTREMISALQALLAVAEDGLAGPETEAATLAWQCSRGIPQTGRADEMTRLSLLEEQPKPGLSAGDFWQDITYFTREELRCKCGGRYCGGFPTEPREMAVRLADRARKHFGKPAHNVSFLRCPEWNRLQGGVVNSQHMYGEAMDIRIDGVTAGELYSFLKQQPEVRYTYKINHTNVHFDIRKGERQS